MLEFWKTGYSHSSVANQFDGRQFLKGLTCVKDCIQLVVGLLLCVSSPNCSAQEQRLHRKCLALPGVHTHLEGPRGWICCYCLCAILQMGTLRPIEGQWAVSRVTHQAKQQSSREPGFLLGCPYFPLSWTCSRVRTSWRELVKHFQAPAQTYRISLVLN